MSLYLISLVLTMAIEVPLFLILVFAVCRRKGHGPAEPSGTVASRVRDLPDLVLLVVGMNLMSHPIASYLWVFTDIHFLSIELGVIVVEAIVVSRAPGLPISMALIVSSIINTVSATIGAWLFF